MSIYVSYIYNGNIQYISKVLKSILFTNFQCLLKRRQTQIFSLEYLQKIVLRINYLNASHDNIAFVYIF